MKAAQGRIHSLRNQEHDRLIQSHGGGEGGMAHIHASEGEGLLLPLAFEVAASLLIPSDTVRQGAGS